MSRYSSAKPDRFDCPPGLALRLSVLADRHERVRNLLARSGFARLHKAQRLADRVAEAFRQALLATPARYHDFGAYRYAPTPEPGGIVRYPAPLRRGRGIPPLHPGPATYHARRRSAVAGYLVPRAALYRGRRRPT